MQSLTYYQLHPALRPDVPVLSSQYTQWIFTGVRGHFKNAVKLFNNVRGRSNSQSPIWTLVQNIQAEDLYSKYIQHTVAESVHTAIRTSIP